MVMVLWLLNNISHGPQSGGTFCTQVGGTVSVSKLNELILHLHGSRDGGGGGVYGGEGRGVCSSWCSKSMFRPAEINYMI